MLLAISRAKDELTDPARYRALAHTMFEQAADDAARTAAEQALEVAQVYESYEGTLRARRAVDFGDLVMRPALLLETDDAVRRPPAFGTGTCWSTNTRTSTAPAPGCCAPSPGMVDASGWSATPGSPSTAFAARPRRT